MNINFVDLYNTNDFAVIRKYVRKEGPLALSESIQTVRWMESYKLLYL